MTSNPTEPRTVVFCPRDASWRETLAAREVQRYLYLVTGQLPSVDTVTTTVPEGANGVLVASRQRAIVGTLATGDELKAAVAALGPEHYLLRTLDRGDGRVVLIIGGDDTGALYGAYRFAEHLGVRFYLHGDVIPDERAAMGLPMLDERAAPLFSLRGIQPFHDFPEGPDWWNRDDYLAYIFQLPKLRMNFIGLHTYPEGGPNAEPTVWIGLPEDVGTADQVKVGYPASYQNTLRGNWGYAPTRTGDYIFGSAALFERDAYGADVMADAEPQPQSPEACQAVFGRTAAMLRAAFEHAHRLGVRTCVGTETPLTVPKLVQQELKARGLDPADPVVRQQLYAGIFKRIMSAYPLDYYWFWTPEGWTWEGTNEAQVAATVADLQAALAAAKEVGAPFRLATCGWVLGPQSDRALFDRVLPKDVAVSCINRQVGMEPIEPGFARVIGRDRWAIPWMEDDPALTAPQLWAGRMREDAVDARRYGCTGLLGIHWRTRVLAPNIAALAQAAWDQSWHEQAPQPIEPSRVEGPEGGRFAAFPDHKIAGTDAEPLYQTVRWNVNAYHLKAPDGKYVVTLKFCDPHYAEKGKRVFGVKLQGRTVIDSLDIVGQVGQNRALDFAFVDVEVAGGWIDIEFVRQVEFACIAAVSVEGPGFVRRINCGGPAYQDYAADWPPAGTPKPRGLPTDDFYADWAKAEFGAAAGAKAAPILARIDGKLPRPADWVNGPGGLKPDARAWSEAAKDYAFVDDLAALRPLVKGAGNTARFEYWLSQFCYMRAMAKVNCSSFVFNQTLEQVKAERDDEARRRVARSSALPAYVELVADVREVFDYLLATISTPGELGTVANWNQHLLPSLLTAPGQELAHALGEPLPANAGPELTYSGPPRLIVPTVRSQLDPGEALTLKLIVLANQPPRELSVHWRLLGQGEFVTVPATHVARGVYTATLPPLPTTAAALEYYVRLNPGDREALYFPATAPEINQTVVVLPDVRQ